MIDHKNKIKLSMDDKLLFIIFLGSILTIFEGPVAALSSCLVFICIVLLFTSDRFYCVLPILIFFYSYLVMPGGVVVFRLYALLFLIKMVIKKQARIEQKYLIPLFVLILYSLQVIGLKDLRLALSIVIDLIFVVVYICTYLKERSNFISFFRMYAYAAVCATVFGFFRMGLQLNTALFIDGQWVFVTRFLATFNDPNYIGFFFNIAIFTIICMKLFKNKFVKVGLLFVLYLSLIATLSTTALLCNFIALLIYLFLSKKITIKVIVIILLVIPIILSIYQRGLTKDIPIISDASYKIQSKLRDLSNVDMEGFTTKRSLIWENHMNYYKGQDTIKFLLGGNILNCYKQDSNDIRGVSHNDMITLLLSVGLLGTMMLLSFYFFSSFLMVRCYIKTKDTYYLALVVIKFIWLFYAFGLTMFPSWLFYLFFFI